MADEFETPRVQSVMLLAPDGDKGAGDTTAGSDTRSSAGSASENPGRRGLMASLPPATPQLASAVLQSSTRLGSRLFGASVSVGLEGLRQTAAVAQSVQQGASFRDVAWQVGAATLEVLGETRDQGSNLLGEAAREARAAHSVVTIPHLRIFNRGDPLVSPCAKAAVKSPAAHVSVLLQDVYGIDLARFRKLGPAIPEGQPLLMYATVSAASDRNHVLATLDAKIVADGKDFGRAVFQGESLIVQLPDAADDVVLRFFRSNCNFPGWDDEIYARTVLLPSEIWPARFCLRQQGPAPKEALLRLYPPSLTGRMRHTLASGDMEFFVTDDAALGAVRIVCGVRMERPPLLGYLRSRSVSGHAASASNVADQENTQQEESDAEKDATMVQGLLWRDWGDVSTLVGPGRRSDLGVLFDIEGDLQRMHVMQSIPLQLLSRMQCPRRLCIAAAIWVYSCLRAAPWEWPLLAATAVVLLGRLASYKDTDSQQIEVAQNTKAPDTQPASEAPSSPKISPSPSPSPTPSPSSPKSPTRERNCWSEENGRRRLDMDPRRPIETTLNLARWLDDSAKTAERLYADIRILEPESVHYLEQFERTRNLFTAADPHASVTALLLFYLGAAGCAFAVRLLTALGLSGRQGVCLLGLLPIGGLGLWREVTDQTDSFAAAFQTRAVKWGRAGTVAIALTSAAISRMHGFADQIASLLLALWMRVPTAPQAEHRQLARLALHGNPYFTCAE